MSSSNGGNPELIGTLGCICNLDSPQQRYFEFRGKFSHNTSTQNDYSETSTELSHAIECNFDHTVTDAVPLIIQLAHQDADLSQTCDWIHNNQSEIEKRLLSHGAILFRGFPIDTADAFDAFVSSFEEYVCGVIKSLN